VLVLVRLLGLVLVRLLPPLGFLVDLQNFLFDRKCTLLRSEELSEDNIWGFLLPPILIWTALLFEKSGPGDFGNSLCLVGVPNLGRIGDR